MTRSGKPRAHAWMALIRSETVPSILRRLEGGLAVQLAGEELQLDGDAFAREEAGPVGDDAAARSSWRA